MCVMSIYSFIGSFLIGSVMTYFGFVLGKRAGIYEGMRELISIIKVYDPKLKAEISEMFKNIERMSREDRENAFYDYLEKMDDIDEEDKLE